ncbi:MAG: aminotransferase class I/II-fold pyridoxal phosphate-dependent enzyme [Clostridia bacterium]|nr:aminotransferase class I/II-fold pyridoxal phosphate-dependent enzyme [Clostridia bacterium]
MKPPIYNGLMKYISRQRTQFTSPGHKGKVRMRTESLCKLDLSYLPETDEILNPKSFILESENEIATIFGASHSFYLTNGATGGIYAALATLCHAGDKIIVDSECDKSVINAITMLALIPVFIQRNYNKKYDINGGIDTEELEYLTEQNRDAKLILITSPTYYGVCANIKKAAEIAHEKNMLLMVDEALGAHFIFSKHFPESATECGADIVVHSMSKTLGGFSGSGFLHICTDEISTDAIREQLAIYLGTGSMAFLCATENAAIYAASNSKKYNAIFREIERGKYLINRSTDIRWFDSEFNNASTIDQTDKSRIVLNFSKVDITAGDAAKILINKYGIEPEAADRDNLIFSVTLYNTPTEIRKLVNSCMSIAKLTSPKLSIEDDDDKTAPRKTVKVLPFKAFNCDGEKISYTDANGRLCKKMIYQYPHGTPIVIPGEKISEYHIERIDEILHFGGTLSGIDEEGCIEVLSLTDSFYF